MRKLFDCFLYNNELELLRIRLQLLSGVVDRFVIVSAAETFTGRRKKDNFPVGDGIVSRYLDKIELIGLDRLEGRNAWEKESFSRNSIAGGLSGLAPDDLFMVSDVDELPRPEILQQMKGAEPDDNAVVLGLGYFNFKFNYRLVHGRHAIWPGPVLCRYGVLTTPQLTRELRWAGMSGERPMIHDAGWHFSFLAAGRELADKLDSFSHQEQEIQARRDDIQQLIGSRQGFHDHLHPGSVWAVVRLDDFGCADLERLVLNYPAFIAAGEADDSRVIRQRISAAVYKICTEERGKILRDCTLLELAQEVWRRMRHRIAP